jgi:integrase
LEAFRAEVGAVQHGDGPGAEKVGHFLRRWIAVYPTLPTRRGTRPAPGTVDNYRQAVRDHLDKPPFNDIRLDKLRTADVNDLIAVLQAKTGPDGKPCLGDGGIKKVLTALSGALTYARKRGLIAANPITDADQPSYEAPPLVVPTPEEVRAVVVAAKALDNQTVGEALILAARTGMRRGEVCGLQVRHFDPATGRLRVEQQVKHGIDGEGWIIGATKTTKSNRTISLSDDCQDMLTSRVKGRLSQEFIFTEDDGGPLKPWRLTDGFQRIAISLGMSTTKVHSLRHYQSTEGLKKGVSLRTIAGRLGDDPKTVLSTYARYLAGDDQDAADLIASL